MAENNDRGKTGHSNSAGTPGEKAHIAVTSRGIADWPVLTQDQKPKKGGPEGEEGELEEEEEEEEGEQPEGEAARVQDQLPSNPRASSVDIVPVH